MSYVPSVNVIAMQLHESIVRVTERDRQLESPRWHELREKERDFYVEVVRDLLERGVLCRPIHS